MIKISGLKWQLIKVIESKVYFCLKCTLVEEVTKTIVLDRIETHVGDPD